MDRFADDEHAIGSNPNNSMHVYKMHDSNAYPALDVLCVNTSNNNNNNNNNNINNNNNEKMDDANQTVATAAVAPTSPPPPPVATATLRQDSINSDFSPLIESVQINDDQHTNDDEYSSVNDNHSNASSSVGSSNDEHASSDNNSTDNISFVSEDIVENIIVLPNNFLSEDDESTNSDDVVYAYRGADVGDQLNDIGGGANADDETDYLEMDFEDPASEIEAPEMLQQHIEPMLPLPPLKCNHITTAPLHQTGYANVTSTTLADQSGLAADRNMERTGVHKSWLAPIDVRHANGIHATNENHDGSNFVNIQTTNNNNNNNNKLDVNGVATMVMSTPPASSIERESNKSLEIKKMTSSGILAAAVAQSYDDPYSSPYYDNTVSLSTKKYTGTIPKTNNNSKLQLHVRSTKTRATECNDARVESHVTTSSSTPTPSASASHIVSSLDLRSAGGNHANKRWKITDQTVEHAPLASTSFCDSFLNFNGKSGSSANCGHTNHTATVVRSMSFPNGTDSSYQRVFAIRCEPTGADNDVGQPASVTFESTYCTIETIIKALEKINVCPDVRVLGKALRDGDGQIIQLNIPEYLVYASKRYCNYKAIVAAIEQSCDDVDVKFYSTEMSAIETVNIPFRMIASRLPTNGSLTNILAIKNRRFHQMNVLGKIVNMIRRFPDMRDDLIHNEFITIPQYYSSGVICVSKKEPSSN